MSDEAQNSTPVEAAYEKPVRQAVTAGLDAASAPLPGFFRKRSKDAVYAAMADEVVRELQPVLEYMVSEAVESAGSSSGSTGEAYHAGYDEGRTAGYTEAERYRRSTFYNGYDEGRIAALKTLRAELQQLERTPRKALEMVEEHLRNAQKSEAERRDG